MSTKAFINLEHPYSVFSKGSIETLEKTPLRDNINIGDRLIAFFRRQYLPQKSILVVVGAQDVSYLERWVAPFSDTLVVSSSSGSTQQQQQEPPFKEYFPGQFLFSSRQGKQVILKRTQVDELLSPDTERLTMQWITNLDYRNVDKLVTINEVAFVLSQVRHKYTGAARADLLNLQDCCSTDSRPPRTRQPLPLLETTGLDSGLDDQLFAENIDPS
jgi:secreted Zn-dependent insulinase-like peptidase